jgi:anti-anti-sigma factor
MKVNLVVVEGVHQGKLIPLKTERFEIGRGEGCQLRPKSPTVSIRHCAIVRRGRNVIVEDLGSSNGTLVNERCLKMGDEVRVSDGDRLQVGQLIFVFQVDQGAREEGGRLEDWLKSEPISGPAASGVDMNSRTMLMASPVPVDPSVAVNGPNERVSSPSPDANANAARFAYRVFDGAHKVVILGLSQDQLEDDEAVRSLRKTLFGLVVKKKVNRMVLDIASIDVLPSLAVAAFLALARQCELAHGGLRLCGASPSVKRMVTALRLADVIASYDEKNEAVTAPWG